MKNHIIKYLVTFIILMSIIFTGCGSYQTVPYSFAANGVESASIRFQHGNPGISFVSLEGVTLPRADSGTRWGPILFPANRELRISVYARYETKTNNRSRLNFGVFDELAQIATTVNEIGRNVDTQVMFNCPELEPGRSYTLAFIKGSGIPGKNRLVLTEVGTMRVVYEQEFSVSIGGYHSR